jgi:hypothetical protein
MFRADSPRPVVSQRVSGKFETTLVYPDRLGTYYFRAQCGNGRTGRSVDFAMDPAVRRLAIGRIQTVLQRHDDAAPGPVSYKSIAL